MQMEKKNLESCLEIWESIFKRESDGRKKNGLFLKRESDGIK